PEPEPEPEPEVETPVAVAEIKTETKPTRQRRPKQEAKKEPTADNPTPSKSTTQAAKPAAPVAGKGEVDPKIEDRWKQQVRVHLERRKRYPRQAQRLRQEGTPVVRFRLDKNGRVSRATIQQGSGVTALDKEAVQLVERSQPLPKPPPELLANSGNSIELTLPIEFSLTSNGR